MNKDLVYGNRLIQKKDYDRARQLHLQTIRKAKPVVKPLDGFNIDLNNKKKQYQKQARFTEIQRENRLLLTKITSIMNKTKRNQSIQRQNKSLNSSRRKKQLQQIEIQNARFLRRLQEGKPNYETKKMKTDWIKLKNSIKMMSRTPFMLTGRPKNQRANSFMNRTLSPLSPLKQKIVQLERVRVINGCSFFITIQLNSKKLRIIGDCLDTKQLKVVQIPKDEAIQFIEQELQGKIQMIFNQLRYDRDTHTLYLIAKSAEIEQLLESEKKTWDKYELHQQSEEQSMVSEQKQLKNAKSSSQNLPRRINLINMEEKNPQNDTKQILWELTKMRKEENNISNPEQNQKSKDTLPPVSQIKN